MSFIQNNPDPNAAKNSASNVLFVEGNSDEIVIGELLRNIVNNKIRIEKLGSFSILKKTAQALHPYHPNYYFLIDRDFHTDEYVEKCWESFSNPNKPNLLIWRKREIENYFLDPNFLIYSKFCPESNKKLIEKKILSLMENRIFLEVANRVLDSMRGSFYEIKLENFTNPSEFASIDNALHQLREYLSNYIEKVNITASYDNIEAIYNTAMSEMTGGQEKPSFGRGKWLSMISGKEILHELLSSDLFQVKNNLGKIIQKKEIKFNAIFSDLLSKNEEVLPKDFVRLRNLISERIEMSAN